MGQGSVTSDQWSARQRAAKLGQGTHGEGVRRRTTWEAERSIKAELTAGDVADGEGRELVPTGRDAFERRSPKGSVSSKFDWVRRRVALVVRRWLAGVLSA